VSNSIASYEKNEQDKQITTMQKLTIISVSSFLNSASTNKISK